MRSVIILLLLKTQKEKNKDEFNLFLKAGLRGPGMTLGALK